MLKSNLHLWLYILAIWGSSCIGAVVLLGIHLRIKGSFVWILPLGKGLRGIVNFAVALLQTGPLVFVAYMLPVIAFSITIVIIAHYFLS